MDIIDERVTGQYRLSLQYCTPYQYGPYLTYYADAAYCYRRNNEVCLSVGLSVTILSPAKTAEPIEMPYGMRTWVDVLDVVQIIHAIGQF